MTRHHHAMAVALLLTSPAVAAAQDAISVLNAAAKAMHLEQVNTIRYTARGSQYAIGQSYTSTMPSTWSVPVTTCTSSFCVASLITLWSLREAPKAIAWFREYESRPTSELPTCPVNLSERSFCPAHRDRGKDRDDWTAKKRWESHGVAAAASADSSSELHVRAVTSRRTNRFVQRNDRLFANGVRTTMSIGRGYNRGTSLAGADVTPT